MCSFTLLGWGGGLKNSQYLVWPPFASRSATHLLHIELIRLLIVACGMLVHSYSMAVRSCWILAGTGTRCRIRLIQSIPNMLNGWHVRWVCWPCKSWDVFRFQELCTDPCNMGPCIIMLQHEVMVVDERHNNGTQDLVMVSLCIQNAINKMHLCSLSITYTCPYHNHGPLNPQCWHQQTAHPHDTIHAVCHLPFTVKTGINPWREHLSKVSDTI